MSLALTCLRMRRYPDGKVWICRRPDKTRAAYLDRHQTLDKILSFALGPKSYQETVSREKIGRELCSSCVQSAHSNRRQSDRRSGNESRQIPELGHPKWTMRGLKTVANRGDLLMRRLSRALRHRCILPAIQA